MKLFGTSGIRRLADSSLLELSLKTGLAVGKIYPNVVVGCDTRTSSEAIKYAFTSGALMSGARCCDAGVIPTPTLALAAKEFQAGAMITASHNPPEYNGIKLWNADCSAFDTDQQQQIEDMILNNSLSAAKWSEIGRSCSRDDAIERHIEHIIRNVPTATKLKVALDCGCGAASVISPYLLKRMGCEVIALNCFPSGFFPHPAEPTEANLGELLQATREFSADLGIAHDGDADRMMAVDDKGRFIPGDKLLALFARQRAAREVVTTIDASMSIEEMGFKITRTPVGDTYVSDRLKKGGDFGGEPSGAWVFPENSLCPDGIYAAARLVNIASHQKLSRLIDEIPQYPILRGSIASDGVKMTELNERLLSLKPTSVDSIDGTRLNFKDGWLLIRASGTEPRIRVTAEARTEASVHELYDKGMKTIKECMKGRQEG
ncbi:MAG: phosphoglucosamine mutase [Chloroflexi bacterium]|nr:phosphoglucosamine mutase [Chloroflexota bacterium]